MICTILRIWDSSSGRTESAEGIPSHENRALEKDGEKCRPHVRELKREDVQMNLRIIAVYGSGAMPKPYVMLMDLLSSNLLYILKSSRYS